MIGLLSSLRRHNRELKPLPCPSCGGFERTLAWRRDRYFLQVDLSVCRTCGLAHLARGLTGADAERFYRTTYPKLMRWPPAATDLWRFRIEAAYRLAHIRNIVGPIDKIFEVGSGLGFFLEQCREAGCGEYFGVEPGGPQRNHAEQALKLGDHISPLTLDALAAPPFQPHLTVLFHVLEHLDQPGHALDRLRQWIDPEGWLVIEVPDIEADWTSLGLWQVHVSHRSYFSGDTLGALLRRHGFTPERIEREAFGIFPGNLRVFARPSAAESQATATIDVEGTRRRIVSQIRQWSPIRGYPRAALRLLRLSLTDR